MDGFRPENCFYTNDLTVMLDSERYRIQIDMTSGGQGYPVSHSRRVGAERGADRILEFCCEAWVSFGFPSVPASKTFSLVFLTDAVYVYSLLFLQIQWGIP